MTTSTSIMPKDYWKGATRIVLTAKDFGTSKPSFTCLAVQIIGSDGVAEANEFTIYSTAADYARFTRAAAAFNGAMAEFADVAEAAE